MESYQIGLIINIVIVVIPCLGLSITYFIAGSKKPMYVRIIKSSHGILLLAAFCYAAYASKFTSFGDYGYWMIPLNILVILAGLSAVVSLFNYI